jgi:hypothetical protein
MNVNQILTKAYNKYGSSMGRKNQLNGKPEKLHLRKIRLNQGGYDQGGAYWGNTTNSHIYLAISPDNTENEEPVICYVRAENRNEAKKLVLEKLPKFKFLN